MDLQKIASTGTAVAVLGTGTIVGGNHVIDQQTGGPQKRAKAEATELRQIVREEVREALYQAWPKTTGSVQGIQPQGDYRNKLPENK
mgnify:CR=1 FL=1